jgi:cell fate regulator YaaT (PSP1 superfamily)
MVILVGVKLPHHGKIIQCESDDHSLILGDPCIVETDESEVAFGQVAGSYRQLKTEELKEEPWRVLRRATERDLKMHDRNERLEQEAFEFCNNRITIRKLPMKLERVVFAFDGKKAIFYFTAEGRVDFRQLVRDLASRFKIRIEMRQIGVRDLAGQMGGFGICGEVLCCARHLRGFSPVSIRMAKDQNLTLNPSKISGVCGRLMCCLAYEHPTYCQVKGSMPCCGKKVRLPEGPGRVAKVDIFKEEVLVDLEEGPQVTLRGQRLTEPRGPDTSQEK